MKIFTHLILLCSIAVLVSSDKKPKPSDKYSKEANFKLTENYDPDFRTLPKPFRMAKLNLVWSKAQHRLTEPKLKSLFTELKIHDKEEITWKQVSGSKKDKDGLKEAELRKKLAGIMSTYDLLEHFGETQDPEKYKHHKHQATFNGAVDDYINKSLFKDKKLNRLWEKAETSGFSPEEMKALKEEFEHHQEKVDMYYSLLNETPEPDSGKKDHHKNAVNEDEQDVFNEIATAEEIETANDVQPEKHKSYEHHSNKLREHHRNLRDNFDRLERIAGKGPNSNEFVEPKVQGLWRVAQSSSFTADELASLKVELLHYESRLLKLRHLHAEHALNMEKHKKTQNNDKHDRVASMEEHIKKQSRKVEKLQEHLEKTIFQHTEL